MLRRTGKLERGQASVLLAIAFIALLGFTALAIDGGMVYADRRHAQSGADSSSLAGASAAALYLENHYVSYDDWSCGDAPVIAAQNHNTAGAKAVAIDRALSNDYEIDEDDSDQNGVRTECESGFDNGSWVEKYLDVITTITRDTNTAFVHFVYGGPVRNTVKAVARVYPPTPLAFGNAIVSLATECDEGGILFDGTSGVAVTGGGIFANSCITKNGGVTVDVVGDFGISCVLPDCYTDNGGSGSLNPSPEEDTGTPLPPAAFAVPTPNCSGMTDHGSYNKDGTLEPGVYNDIRITGGEHTMQAGLYCVNGDFIVNGDTLVGSGVTIYLTSGDFQASGLATTRITAPPSSTCGDPCNTYHALPGVLIYLAEGNTNEAALLGTADSEYEGMVYAPSGQIEAGGTTSELSEIHAQLIGYDVKIHGNTSVVINYNEGINYQLPAMLELHK